MSILKHFCNSTATHTIVLPFHEGLKLNPLRIYQGIDENVQVCYSLFWLSQKN